MFVKFGEREIEVDDKKRLEDLTFEMQLKANAEGKVLTKVKVGDEDLYIGSESELWQKEVGKLSDVEFELKSPKEVVESALHDADEYLDRLIPSVEHIALLYRVGEEKEAHELLASLADGLWWLTYVIQGPRAILRMDGARIIKICDELATIVEKIEEAHTKRDWFALSDVLEYELAPHLRKWQTLIREIINEIKAKK